MKINEFIISVIIAFVIFSIQFVEMGYAQACTHYASPTGSGNGISPSSPFQIVDFWSVASPGKTLCLLDGIYRGDRSMINPPENLNGIVDQPITVRALNDGKVTIDGENARRPVHLRYNDYFVLEGFNAHSGSWYVVEIDRGSDNNIVRRIVAWDANPNRNVMVFGSNYNSDNLFEDIAGWGWGRKIIEPFDNTRATFRRCFFRWSGHTHAGGTYRLGASFTYYSTETLYENCIGTWDMLPESMDSPENLAVFGFDREGGGGHRILGSIGYLTSNQERLPYFIFFGPGDSRLNLVAKDIFGYTDLPEYQDRTVAIGTEPQFRYINGVLTSEPLWPWPMNERIKQAMVASGYDKKGGLDGKGGIDLNKVIYEVSGGKIDTKFGSPPPSCSCAPWQNQACGQGGCSQNQMYQTRTCTPSGCDVTSRCISYTSCEIPAKKGDLNNDGNVDIFDYNALVENFGSTNCGNIADISPPAGGDCKVDIFDYNILVENFGKRR